MKKTFTVILVALLVSSGLVSCVKNNEILATDGDIQNTEAITNEKTSYLDSLGEKDFEGASFVWALSEQGNLPAYATELTGEAVNDAMFARDVLVSETYNVNIEYLEKPDSPDTAVELANCVLAGDYFSDLWRDTLSNGGNFMGGAFRKGALYNLMDVPYLSLEQSWWSSLIYEQLQYNGKMFFTSGDMATASYYAPACTFMNVAVANNNDIDVTEMYRLVYEDAWTIDEMIERTNGLHVDLNGDGVMNLNDDAYGVVSATVYLTATEICIGAGIQFSKTDGNGNLTLNMNTEQSLNTLNKLKECFNEIKPDDDWAPFKNVTFKSDHALFMVHFVQSALDLRDMDSDFIILPMPKYNVEQKSYMSYTNPFTHSYIAMPLIQRDVERTGFITEVLEYLSVEMVRPTIYDVTLKAKTARDPDSQAMLDIIFDTSYIDFIALNNFGGSAQAMCDILFAEADFASEFKRIESVVNEELAAYLALFD